MGRRDTRTTTQKGYGWAHQEARRHAIRDMPDGTRCTRCAQPMWRSDATRLDLDHSDDRTTYNGLAHSTCNRRAGQAKAMRARTPAAREPRSNSTYSRNW